MKVAADAEKLRREGADVVALSGRFLVFRRTRAWRAFDTLVQRRDPLTLEHRFLKRARSLGLSCTVTHRKRRSPWTVLRQMFTTTAPVRT